MKLKEILHFIETEIMNQITGLAPDKNMVDLAEAKKRAAAQRASGETPRSPAKRSQTKAKTAAAGGKKRRKVGRGHEPIDRSKKDTSKERGSTWHKAATKGTVPTVRGRKLGPKGSPGYVKREKIGDAIFKSIKDDPKKKKKFVDAARSHGEAEKEWPAFVWAAASNQAISPGSGLDAANKKKPKGKKADAGDTTAKKGGSKTQPEWPKKSPGIAKKRRTKKDSKDKDQLNLDLK